MSKEQEVTGFPLTFVLPSLNNSFIPGLMNSGAVMNSNSTVALSPVLNMP